MKSLWNDTEASEFSAKYGDLGLRVYTSRLLGRDKSLVMHGGGNTSVKLRERNLFGEEETTLYVKGSGWDLEFIEPQGFAPVCLEHVRRLAGLPVLSDPEMVSQLMTHRRTLTAPAPSIETILHGLLPFRFVDHTHADAVLAVSNTEDGERRISGIYRARCLVIPYVMPGFDLARQCAKAIAEGLTAETIGIVLLNHGIVSFGEDARESYERMIELVGLAEDYLSASNAWTVFGAPPPTASPDPLAQAALRSRLSRAAHAPLILRTTPSGRAGVFARHANINAMTTQGPITPDHVIRTKRIPMFGTDVDRYVADYRAYFERHAPGAAEPKSMLDPAPRVVVDPAFGCAAAGRKAGDAVAIAEIYDHTMEVILRAEALGGFRALGEKQIFDVEYWDLEQAKLHKGGKPQMFAGEVALVTGAASGIGRASVNSFLARGAAVVAVDLNSAVASMLSGPDYLGVACDVTDEAALRAVLARAALEFGGIDMLVLNAGILGETRRIAELAMEQWRRVMAVNLDANLSLLRACYPYLKLAPQGGRVAVIGSKNVPAPGPGVAAYSASKAALQQLARVAALEWGADGIRVNTLHPNGVFDTGLWTEDILAQRAAQYGLTVEQYKTRNVLKAQVSSRDVAELAAELCGPLFAKTTGAQVSVDGGDERVI